MSKKTILIVDDDKNILNGLAEILGIVGFEVIKADAGTEALKILSIKNIDLLIVDILMPEVDGKKILSLLKEAEPDMPIIIITGFDIEITREYATKYKANGFLPKPIEAEDLINLVNKILQEN